MFSEKKSMSLYWRCNSLFNVTKIIRCWSESSLETNIGLYITTSNEKGHGTKNTNRFKPLPNSIYTKQSDPIYTKPNSLVGFSRNIFFELLPDNITNNLDGYWHQLEKLNAVIQLKKPELLNREGVVFHQDNARPHTRLFIRQRLLQL